MTSPASIAKHPMHPMLVALPIGLWIFSFASDVIYLMKWGGSVWENVALYTMGGGIVTALVAALPGLIDLLSLPAGNIKRIGIWHMSINLVIVAIFAIDLWLRLSAVTSLVPFLLSVIGVALLSISGWLGGEMVYVHGVAVNAQSTREEAMPERPAAPRRVA